jgi:M6 family metalloprotease-like protein
MQERQKETMKSHVINREVPSRNPLVAALAVLFAAVSVQVMGVPALDRPFELHQPNGVRFKARQNGDEFFNWISANGKVVELATDGYWQWVSVVKGRAALSGRRVGIDVEPLTAATRADIGKIKTARLASESQYGWQLTDPDQSPLGSPPSAPTEKLLVILVSFTDRAISTTPAAWSSAFFGTSGKTVRTYYDAVSRNTFHFAPANESYGTANDGIVMVSLNRTHPDTRRIITDSNRLIVRDALKAADAFVDFASFDSNGDKVLSRNELHVFVVVAGFEASYLGGSTPSVWGHHSGLGGTVAAPTLDGVTVCATADEGGYSQVGELHDDHMATIGILCHELGHDIGLPDLYDTDKSSSGVGAHCLMGSGSWGFAPGENDGATPVMMCAWSRIQLGFLSPTILTSPGTYAAFAASDPGSANAFKIATPNPGEYFVIENRQLTGFDAGLYGYFRLSSGGTDRGGLAIWHIDDNQLDNTDENHKMVDLEEANEGALGYRELDLDSNCDDGSCDPRGRRGNRQHYFYAGNATAFDNTTTPNSRLYNGAASGVAIRSVSASGPSMTFELVSTGTSANRPPVLSNPRVTPQSGTAATTFEYLIDYYDPDGDAPLGSYRTVYLSDGRQLTMSLKTGSPANGTYSCTTTLSSGTHSYWFYFVDIAGNAAVSGWHDGPTVYAGGNAVINIVIQCQRISSDLRLKYSTVGFSGPWTDIPITKAILDPLVVPAGSTLYFEASVTSPNYEYREWEGLENGVRFGGSTSSIWSFKLGTGTTEVGLNVYYRYTPKYYSISGTVLLNTGGTVPGGVDLVLTSSEQTLTTHTDNGNWSFANVCGGVSVTITPRASGYAFSPASLVFHNVNENEPDQRITAYSSDDYVPTMWFTSLPPAVTAESSVTFAWVGQDNVSAPANLLYQYKLDGLDADWSAWTSATRISYNLANGCYTFWLRAKDEAGNINQAPTNFTFVVNAAPKVLSAVRNTRSVWSSRVTVQMPVGALYPTNTFVLLPEHSGMEDTDLVPVRIHKADSTTPSGANAIIAQQLGLPVSMTKLTTGWLTTLPDNLSPGQTASYDIVWGKVAYFGWKEWVNVPRNMPNGATVHSTYLNDDFTLWRLATKRTENPWPNSWVFMNASDSTTDRVSETILRYVNGQPLNGSYGTYTEFPYGFIHKAAQNLYFVWYDQKYEWDGQDRRVSRYGSTVFDPTGAQVSSQDSAYGEGLADVPKYAIGNELWFVGYVNSQSLWFEVRDFENRLIVPKTTFESFTGGTNPRVELKYTPSVQLGDKVLLLWTRRWYTSGGYVRKEICYQVRTAGGQLLRDTTVLTPVLSDAVEADDRFEIQRFLPDGSGKVWLTYYRFRYGAPTSFYYIILDQSGNVWRGPVQTMDLRYFNFCDKDGVIWATEGGVLFPRTPDDTEAASARTATWVPTQNVGRFAASVSADGYRLYDRWSPQVVSVEISAATKPTTMEVFDLNLWSNDLHCANITIQNSTNTVWSQSGQFTGNASVPVSDKLLVGQNVLTVTQNDFLGGQLLITFPYSYTHLIRASGDEHVVISPSGDVLVNHGANATFTFTPLEGYHIANVEVDYAPVGTNLSYTFLNVTQNHILHVYSAKNEVNHAPTLAAIDDRTVNEGELIAFIVSATDPDVPSNTLSFALDPGAPEGAMIHKDTGAFYWRPSEAQGPGTFVITVRVTDNGVPPLSATTSFTCTVREVNQKPVLVPIANQVVEIGETFKIQLQAKDDDLPPNTLTYSFAKPPPEGAVLDPMTGILTWMPSNDFESTTNRFVVRVTDNGIPELSDTNSFNVTVIPPRPITLSARMLPSRELVLQVRCHKGQTLFIETSSDLVHWTLLTIAIRTGDVTEIKLTTSNDEKVRFYRVVVP